MTPSPSLPPSITVIIPVYNGAATLRNAIASTLRQPVPNLAVLVVDDASTDATRQVVQQMGERVQLLTRAINGGPAAARNSGLAHAQGEYIAFLDADDSWVEDGLAQLLAAMVADPARIIVQGQFVDQWPTADADGESRTGAPRFANRLTGTLFHRSVFAIVGLLDERLRRGEDFDFWVRLRHHGLAVTRLEEVVTTYTRRPHQETDRAARHYQSLAQTLKRNLDRHRE